jgi:archaellum component FlaC
MKICQACTDEIRTSEDHLECVKCHEIYHASCLNIGSEDITSIVITNWFCPLCMMKQPKGDNSECLARPSTPTTLAECSFNVTRRKTHNKLDIAAANNRVNTREFIRRSDLHDLLKEEMKNVLNSINLEMRANFNKFAEQFDSFKTSIEYMSDKFDKISDDVSRQQQELTSIKKENSTLRAEVNTLTNKVNLLDQLSRSSALEIQCVPEKKGENVLQLVKQLGRAVKCNITDQDISYCSRVAKINPSSARPRTIIAKFNLPRTRDNVLSAVTRHNKENPQDKLNTHDMGFNGEKKSPVFVIENLSHENKQLHAAARQRCKELNYRFVWVRGGRVFVRKNETSEAVFIRDTSILDRL